MLHLICRFPESQFCGSKKNKLSYRFCDELACLIAQQVDDYQHHKIPRYYGEKGYFNTIDFKWCTKRMSSFDDNKVKD